MENNEYYPFEGGIKEIGCEQRPESLYSSNDEPDAYDDDRISKLVLLVD